MAEESGIRLTLADVARACGVSEMTVSRVLRGQGHVSAGTRQRVLAAAGALGYVPNRIAGALASQRVGLVGVVVPSLSNLVFPEVLDGIARGLEGSPLQAVVGVSRYSEASEAQVVREMLSWRPSGLILAGLEHAPETRRMLEGAGVPVVEIMDVDGAAVDACVGISHRTAGQRMAGEVLARGYRNIALLGTGQAADHRARKRMEGFEAALAAAGLAPVARAAYAGGSSLVKGREMAAAVLAEAPEADFLYAGNDVIAAGALLHCLDAGLAVPGRIGVAGFNGIALLEGLPLALATMDARRAETGQRAAQIVLDRLAGGTPSGPLREELAPRLIEGGTMRPRG